MEEGKKTLGTRWVFKKKYKEDGIIFRSRLVVQGFGQMPGVDFTESYLPTANNTTLRTTLVYCLFKQNWVANVINIVTAFLEGELDETVYIEIPEGYELDDDPIDREEYVMLLLKVCYGLVQAPRAFYKKFAKILTADNIGMVVSALDPCLFMKKNEQGETILVMVIHVDDCCICGEQSDIEWLKKVLVKHLTIKDKIVLKKHLGIHYEFLDDGGLRMHQDDYINNIINTYEEEFGKAKEAKMPGFPGTDLMKNEGETMKLLQY